MKISNSSLNTALCIILLSATYGCSSTRNTGKKNMNFSDNKVIAHRGAWKNTGAPQNSIAALQHAIRLGCAGSEFDIRLSADEVMIINHDADHQSLDIEKSTYAELLNKPLLNGEKISTLEQYLRSGMNQKKTRLVAEIKPSPSGKTRSLLLAGKVVEMVKKLNASSHVVYISFDYDIMKKVKELDPAAPVQYLNGDIPAEQLKKDGIDADYHFSIFKTNAGWISEARQLGVVVNAWTVNNVAMMEEFLNQGIDFITTDEPEKMIELQATRTKTSTGR